MNKAVLIRLAVPTLLVSYTFSIAAFVGKKPEARKVTLIVLKRYPASVQENPDYGRNGVMGAGVNPYTALFLLDVNVSDDMGKTYSISCFEYHAWNHCRPETDSYAAEIIGEIIRITGKDQKHTSYKVKYHIDGVRPFPPAQP